MNSLQIYLKEINKYKLLGAEEESFYLKKVQQGDKNARNILINSNLRLVVSVAKKYQNRGIDLEDLIEYGNEGLIRAVERFNPEKNVRFSTYAVWPIRDTIISALKKERIKLLCNKKVLLGKIYQIPNHVSNLPLGKQINYISSKFNLSPTKIKESINLSLYPLSLDYFIYRDKENSPMLKDTVSSNHSSPDEEIINKNLKEKINKIFKILSPKERKVIEYRYGLNDKKRLTLEAIGKLFGLTRERIRQIEEKVLRRLKRRKEHFEDYYHN